MPLPLFITRRNSARKQAVARLRSSVALLVLAFAIFSPGCELNRKEPMQSPRGYNLNDPEVIKLPIELDEISGLAYSRKDASLFAINDERGYLYKIHPDKPDHIERWHFAESDDYEDVVLLPPYFFVMNSGGGFTVFRFATGKADLAQSFTISPPSEGGNEFEACYWSPRFQRILMVCKACSGDTKDSNSVFALDPRTSTWTRSNMSVNSQEIASLLNQEEIRFKPSAASIHPLTGEVYMVSAVNKLLVVASSKGNVKNVYPLDHGLFKQPEGIAFSPTGTMFISNEAADIGVANILVFRYAIAQPAPAK